MVLLIGHFIDQWFEWIAGADDHPELVGDAFWDVVVPEELLHSAESRAPENPFQHPNVHPLDHTRVDGIPDDLPTSNWVSY